ncbi:hypothetical protein [Cellulomonas denverensis]|uniref:hypothetical protein n=1 Tax=Cellulomonas denverensis TaxID=264297 RepID=UPI0035EBF955
MTQPTSRDAPARDVLEDAAEVFALLSAPGRLHLLWILSNDEVDVTTLVAAVGGTKVSASTWPSCAWPDGSTHAAMADACSTESPTPTSSPSSTKPSNTSSTCATDPPTRAGQVTQVLRAERATIPLRWPRRTHAKALDRFVVIRAIAHEACHNFLCA